MKFNNGFINYAVGFIIIILIMISQNAFSEVKSDKYSLGGNMQFSVSGNLKYDAVNDAGSESDVASIKTDFSIKLKEKDAEVKDDYAMNLIYRIDWSTVPGTLTSANFTRGYMNLPFLYVVFNDLLIKDVNIWMGDKSAGRGRGQATHANHNLRGFGFWYEPKGKYRISIDLGGYYQAQTFWYNQADKRESFRESLYDPQGNHQALEYYLFVDSANRERIRRYYSALVSYEKPIGKAGKFGDKDAIVGVNASYHYLPAVSNGRLKRDYTDEYGELKEDTVGYPWETGFGLGVYFSVYSIENLQIHFSVGGGKSLGISSGSAVGAPQSFAFDFMTDPAYPRDQYYETVQSDRTIANLAVIDAENSVIYTDPDFLQVNFRAFTRIFARGLHNEVGDRIVNLSTGSRFIVSEYLQVGPSVGYNVRFFNNPRYGLYKQAQFLTLGLSTVLPLEGRVFGGNQIAFNLSTKYRSKAALPTDEYSNLVNEDLRWTYTASITSSYKW